MWQTACEAILDKSAQMVPASELTRLAGLASEAHKEFFGTVRNDLAV
jgi:hypothetical protein